jgi:hypothetical protein
MFVKMEDGKIWKVNLENQRLENPTNPDDYLQCLDNSELLEIAKEHCFDADAWTNFMIQLHSDRTIVKERTTKP